MDPARRPSHRHPTAWGLMKALTERWARYPSTLTLWSQVKLARGQKHLLCPAMGCPQPSPGQRSNCKEQFPFLCKTSGSGAITCPTGRRIPVDAKQARRAPTSTSHKRQERGVFLMALLTSESDLLWVAKRWGMKNPKAAITLFFTV